MPSVGAPAAGSSTPTPHDDPALPDARIEKKEKARRTGTRGETYGYWYLRRHGYVFVAKNYMPAGAKGELDLVGYDGETLAFVEIRTRTISDNPSALPALPELSVTRCQAGRARPHRPAFLVRPPRSRLPHPLRRPGHRQYPRPIAGSPPAQRRLQPPIAPINIATIQFRRNRGTITHQSDPAPPRPVQSSVEEDRLCRSCEKIPSPAAGSSSPRNAASARTIFCAKA